MGDWEQQWHEMGEHAAKEPELAGAGAPIDKKTDKNHTGLKVFAVLMTIVLVFTLLTFAGYVVYQDLLDSQRTQQMADATPSQPHTTLSIVDSLTSKQETATEDGQLTSQQIAEKVMPSVVGILAYTTETAMEYASGGSGSGIIMSKDGYIITNAHVVMNQKNNRPVDKVEVYLTDGTMYLANMIGIDSRTDIAVIKIQAESLVPAEFGDSREVKIGEKAVAIGNPTGLTLAGSFTQGVISGVNREVSIGVSGYTMSCLQTDAAINPGNSGGALVNAYGQVIGINSAKIAATDYEGIGFAIPIHEIQSIVDNLIENGYVSNRVKVGITFTSVTEALSELRGVPTGLRVVTVDKTSDAYTKGLKSGDIIVGVDGHNVITLAEISNILEEKVPGDTVTLEVYRVLPSGEEKTFKVKVILLADESGKMVD